MKKVGICLLCLFFLPFNSASVLANSGDFSGSVAVGSGYAGTYTAPTNGLIVQGSTGIGTSAPVTELDVNGGVRSGYDSNSCSSSNEGTQRYNTSIHNYEFCNGTTWQAFATGSGGAGNFYNATGTSWIYCSSGHAVAGGAACDVSINGYATELRYSMPVFVTGQVYPSITYPAQAIGWYAACGYFQGSFTAPTSIWVECE